MWSTLLVAAFFVTARSKQLPSTTEISTTAVSSITDQDSEWSADLAPLDTLAIACEKDNMHVTISLAQNHANSVYDTFNGIVYPAGLGSNSSCLREYVSARGDLQYTVPLKGCNTMSTDHEDGTVEYYNNIIVQPHLRLVTGQGRGYHVRCRYRRRDLTLYNLHKPHADRLTNVKDDYDTDEFDEESGLLPSVTMKIYKGKPEEKQVASNVRIGDTLTLVVSLEKQRQFGVLVSECSVKDGLGWAEQSLIADDGCPLDGEIMGLFQYSTDKQEAQVSFPAHKFPYTASVYYTCEVKLCDLNHPTDCEPCSHKRVRRQLDEGSPATVEVFSGLYVNEADSLDNDEVTSEKKEDEICISHRNFAIGICVAGIILMICVIAAIGFILAKRRNPKTYSRTGSSLYSGPYTNTGYSHTS
ncbi:cuticlin-4 isoform X1 [Leptidea sinapis]|uniref:cuticlin-4 isoform X1 n=1 Tax=Leptidea sinapis TaxID=189913 RepID=UPI00214045A4|nr:cuticlin-4 isoform X1 [Leptidea sinapis]XP_050669244.1 cuticlin-4 isoform X2 [Leptidea sinapis]XP_050669245.1 cuticlin-4 isoform X3 [Leptidea sinapis]XP_050669246.1 cuticlin-4 isoform X4 [Leptidea sinapis]XP_050669247.1 cuticlin-4 isoform X1 [Leptidea sinapis]